MLLKGRKVWGTHRDLIVPHWDGVDLQQQQAEETQQPLPWLFCASNPTPGTRERRSESDKAQAFFAVFMPHFFIPSHKEDRQAVRELGGGVICETRALQAAVIPAKAGIHSANFRKCAVHGLDSRFRGNDRRFARDDIASDTTTGSWAVMAFEIAPSSCPRRVIVVPKEAGTLVVWIVVRCLSYTRPRIMALCEIPTFWRHYEPPKRPNFQAPTSSVGFIPPREPVAGSSTRAAAV